MGRGLWEKKGLREAKLDICSRRPVQPVSAMRGGVVTELSALKGRAWGGAGLGEGGLTDAVVDKLGRLRQKGLMRRGDLANQSSGGKGS